MKKLFTKNYIPWNKGKHLSDKHKFNLSLSHIGYKHTKEAIKNMSIAQKGLKMKPFSKQARKNMGLASLGRKHTQEWKQKHSELMKKNWESNLERRISFQEKTSGENNWRWVKDRTKLQKYGDDNKDRRSSIYREWKWKVKIRDNQKCKINNKDCEGRIEAHHILGYKEHPELRYDINNGITLCHFHHPRKIEDEINLSPYFKKLVMNVK